MPLTALTHSDSGEPRQPEGSREWQEWVSASATRNYCLADTLLDWLALYGRRHGYLPDSELPGYDARTDIMRFFFEQGNRFEEAVVAYLVTRCEVERIACGYEDVRSLEHAQRTFEAMCRGVPIIHQGVLRDAEHRTYGAPDLLVRSDVLGELFRNPGVAPCTMAAPDLPGDIHYVVVDIKFTTLHFTARGTLGDSGSYPAYKAQLAIYNEALARLQGYTPAHAYLLGRGWEQTIQRETERGSRCDDRLAPVAVAEHRSLVEEACAWVRRVRLEGAAWRPAPEPTVQELRANLKSDGGGWSRAVKEIGSQQEDLTRLYQVGVSRRDEKNAEGLMRWTDPRVSAESLGLAGTTYGPRLQAILDINRAAEGPPVTPARVMARREEWWPEPPLEFYVDFETVTDLNDDFSRIPERNGQPLIFMVGCGHQEDGEWQFACFTADLLTEPEEARILDDWLCHMEQVRLRLAPQLERPRVIHWSPAETSFLVSNFNSAAKRHPDRDWSAPNWFDFLGEVIRAEPVAVRGAFGFGLKAIGKALHNLGLIQTNWKDGPADGLGAMVGAWWCDGEARRRGCRMTELDLMREIVLYNEVDCRVMCDVVGYLRKYH